MDEWDLLIEDEGEKDSGEAEGEASGWVCHCANGTAVK